MSRSGAVLAAAVTSSAVAITVAASYSTVLSGPAFETPVLEGGASREQPDEETQQQLQQLLQHFPPTADRFAPRFDGLRFIETLVTAHR